MTPADARPCTCTACGWRGTWQDLFRLHPRSATPTRWRTTDGEPLVCPECWDGAVDVGEVQQSFQWS